MSPAALVIGGNAGSRSLLWLSTVWVRLSPLMVGLMLSLILLGFWVSRLKLFIY
jgi:hypothetical protein